MGVDERFKHTGLVAGCSGSPVYIDGRLAGALAWGYTFSKDPLYGVTPIEEMLEVGQIGRVRRSGRRLCRRRGVDVRFVQADRPGRDRQAAHGPEARGDCRVPAGRRPCRVRC